VNVEPSGFLKLTDQRALDAGVDARRRCDLRRGGWADANGDPTSLASEEASGIQPAVIGMYQRGWTVFSVRHSLTDEAVFPAALYDVKTAIRWVKSRAVEAGEQWCWRLISTVM
jgi:hypothetical protein